MFERSRIPAPHTRLLSPLVVIGCDPDHPPDAAGRCLDIEDVVQRFVGQQFLQVLVVLAQQSNDL
jgi:hypothetical protein